VIVSDPHPARHEPVFSVHTTKPDDVGAIEIIFCTEGEARSFARDRSRDFRVLSASVTSFRIGELGTRHPVAWYVDGEEQSRRFDRQALPDRRKHVIRNPPTHADSR
jgi:hypothetical protein